jgi:CubicO group peptidase (beta-lactamase class C family)
MTKWLLGFMLGVSPLYVLADAVDDAALARKADAMLDAGIASDAPGASVLIARDDQVIYRGARGEANLSLGVPLSAQHVFRIGSITKTFTAATVLKLGTQGKLSLNDPLSKFLPDFPNGAHITVAQLLDHTAGISDSWDVDPAMPLDTAALVKRIAAQAPDFAPGQAWAYSNSGYMLLGAIIEKVTGRSWSDVVHTEFAIPLGLAHTGFYADNALVPDLVTGYSRDGDGHVVLPPYVTITGPGAAGALVSSADDLFRWMRALATDRAMPVGLYQTMSSSKTTDDGTPVNYGYGLMLGTVRGEAVVEHNGGIEGFSSQLTYFPKQHVTVVVLANTDAGTPNPRALAHRLGALAIDKPYTDLQPIKAGSKYLRALRGTYRINTTGKHVLSIDGGKLTIQRDGGPKRLLAVARDDVLFYPDDGTDYIKVIRDKQGSVVALDVYTDGMPPARHEDRIH